MSVPFYKTVIILHSGFAECLYGQYQDSSFFFFVSTGGLETTICAVGSVTAATTGDSSIYGTSFDVFFCLVGFKVSCEDDDDLNVLPILNDVLPILNDEDDDGIGGDTEWR